MRKLPAICTIAAILTGTSSAGDFEESITPPPEAAEWEYGFRAYAWMVGLQGTLGANGVSAPVDIEFGDILDALDMVWSSTFEARKGKWGVMLDFTYLKLSDSLVPVFNAPPAPPIAPYGFEMEMFLIDLVGSYRAVEWEGGWLDLTGGLRWLSIENTIDLTTRPGGFLTAGAKDDWLDPHLGFRVHQDLGSRWYLKGFADAGGFNVGSDLTVQLLAAAGYRLNENVSVECGYRYLKEDYDNGFKLSFDAEMHGPILGMSIIW